MNFACCAFCNIRIFRMCQIAAFSGCSFKAHVRTTSLLTGPVTSAVQRRQDTLPDVSAVCKIPAKAADSALALFPVFQQIDSGCCTVAAHKVRAAEPESAPVTFVSRQAKGHGLTPGVTQGQNGTLTMVCTREGSGRMLDMIVVPLWHLSRSLVYPSRLRSLV
jgi:hypothetical protein